MLYLKNIHYHPPAASNSILTDINLELAPQKLGLVIGPSGSGKSTLLEILAGLAEPTEGKICWGEQDFTPVDLQYLGGIVFQFPERHFCGDTLFEELTLGHTEIRPEDARKALREVGLYPSLELSDSPYNLSGGQQRRLALAVQLIRQPNLLLLDEPTAGLDWSMRQQLVSLLAKLKQHWTLLVVTHDAGDLVKIADCCWSINHGRLQRVEVEEIVS